MRILSLGLDKSVLDPNSKTAKRIADYKGLVDKYIVLVPEKNNKILALFDLYRRAKEIIERDGINLITVQDQYYIGLLGYLLAKKYKIRLEIQIHGFEKFWGIRKLIAKFVIPRADSIRVVSNRIKKFLILNFKSSILNSKITVVPIYVETSNIDRISKIKNDNKFIFLTVGRLVSIKNIGLQIEAMKEVVKKHSNAELWIVGDGPELNNLKFKIKNLKLENKVFLLGWQDNVGNYYAQTDAFLLTSDSEGWGMSVIEAASHGLPIIMTDVGLAGEVIKNNESGLIIPVGDKSGLFSAMFKLIENGDLRERLVVGANMAIKNLPTKEEVLKLYKESWQKAFK
ncbi:MAG: glycosyltransferase family 4 protein [Minisyncoccota bacterium]